MPEHEDQNQRVFYLQVKVTRRVKRRITALAEANHRPDADIIRGALYFGLPILEYILAMERKLTGLVIGAIEPESPQRGRPLKEIFDKFR